MTLAGGVISWLTFGTDSFQGAARDAGMTPTRRPTAMETKSKLMRQVRYGVAMSLDGFIAGPNGEADWIVMDPSIDFGALFKEFDTAVMGRKTYEGLTAQGGSGRMPGLEVVVFSRTLPSSKRQGVRILNEDPREVVSALKGKPGRDI